MEEKSLRSVVQISGDHPLLFKLTKLQRYDNVVPSFCVTWVPAAPQQHMARKKNNDTSHMALTIFSEELLTGLAGVAKSGFCNLF